MNLLIVVIEDPDRIEDCLSALVQLDVDGLQVADTSSVVGLLAAQVPLFAGLRQLVTRPTADSKTVFGVTDNPDLLTELDALLRKVDFDLQAPGTGYALLIPLTALIGRLDLDT